MKQPLQRFIRLHCAISRGAFVLAGASLVLFTAIFNMEVAKRYFFNSPTTWSQDVISISTLGVTFLALPYITMHAKHVKIDILTRKLSPRPLAALRLFHRIVFAGVLLMITYITGTEVIKQFVQGTQTASAIAIPKWPILAVMAWGFFSAALHVITGSASEEAQP